MLVRVSFECRKSTTLITLANYKGHRKYSEPIKLKIHVDVTKRGKTCAYESRPALPFLLIG